MAYYMYKKIRDHRKQAVVSNIPLPDPKDSCSNETSISNECSNLATSEEQSDVTQSDQDSERAMRRYRWKIIIGLFFPAFVQGLNSTIIAAALPFIASDFDQFARINWIVTAYNLTSATFFPAWGQFADIFGRYITLQAASLFMILGSAFCAGAPVSAFPMFLVGRGLQGIGSSGLVILMKVIFADKVSLKENAKNTTIFTLVSGSGYCIGPTVGGYLTSVSWRWCFVLNSPIAISGLVLAHFLMRPVLLGPQDIRTRAEDVEGHVSSSSTFFKRLSTIDFGGQMTFLLGMGLIVLALTWAGSSYPWSDARVVGSLISGLGLLLLFFMWEYNLLPGQFIAKRHPHQQAMLPLNLLWTRNASLLMYINFITGITICATSFFIGLYFTIVKQFSSDKAGVSLIFYTPGLAVGVYISMFACNFWPRQTWPPLALGTLMDALGITILALSLRWGHLPTIYGMLAFTGVGTGVRLMPFTLHGVGYYRRQIASIVAVMNFALEFGGVAASTIMLNIFNTRLASAGISLEQGEEASSFKQIAKLPHAQRVFLRQKVKDAIVVAFLAISAFMWLGVVAVLFLGNVDIKRSSKDSDTHDDGETQVESLTQGSYLGSCLSQWWKSGGSASGSGGS